MNPLRRIINGVTDDNVCKRIGWMYGSFFVLFVLVTVLSFYLLPQGIQIFGYNLIPTFLIIGANLLAQQSRLSEERFVPIGYTAFWGLTLLFAVVVGTWSFEVVTVAPPLHRRLVRILDVLHHAGLLEFSAYLLAAVTSFKFTLWYSDRKEIIASRAWKDVRLTRSEKAFLILAFVLLLCAGFVESYGIIHLKG